MQFSIQRMTTPNKLRVAEKIADYSVQPAVTRVNARLDAARMAKLEQLAKSTGLSISDVIRDAIDHYADAHQSANAPSAYEIAQRIGLIGCGAGPADLASNIKRYFAEGLQKKHGHR